MDNLIDILIKNKDKITECIKENCKATFIGALVTLAVIFLVANFLGVTIDSIKQVFSNNNERDKFAYQLKSINEHVDNAESAAHANHRQLLKIVQNDPKFKSLLNISNENQDLIRALMEFGRIYAILVELNEHDERTHGHLSDLYRALLLITADDPLEVGVEFNQAKFREIALINKSSLCSSYSQHTICKAKVILESIERDITDFPKIVRDEVEVELLRYLSYCAARAVEPNNQITYTDKAEELSKKITAGTDINGKIYRRKYYWIDYSKMITVVREGNNNFKTIADKYFQKLRKGLVTEGDFFQLKLVQHEKLITSDAGKKYWQNLISRASP